MGPAQLGGEGAVGLVPAAHHGVRHRVNHGTVVVVVPAGTVMPWVLPFVFFRIFVFFQASGETRDCPGASKRTSGARGVCGCLREVTEVTRKVVLPAQDF